MKIRTDFVSNSSSCGFIVISHKNKETYNFNNQDIRVPNLEQGWSEFGWNERDFHDIWSKINFCAIQLIDLKAIEDSFKGKGPFSRVHKYNYRGCFDRYWEMFKDVCQIEFHLDVELKTHDEISNWSKGIAYIDHGSSISENKNMEMFESRQNLIDFLSCADSYIHTCNDNG